MFSLLLKLVSSYLIDNCHNKMLLYSNKTKDIHVYIIYSESVADSEHLN